MNKMRINALYLFLCYLQEQLFVVGVEAVSNNLRTIASTTIETGVNEIVDNL